MDPWEQRVLICHGAKGPRSGSASMKELMRPDLLLSFVLLCLLLQAQASPKGPVNMMAKVGRNTAGTIGFFVMELTRMRV